MRKDRQPERLAKISGTDAMRCEVYQRVPTYSCAFAALASVMFLGGCADEGGGLSALPVSLEVSPATLSFEPTPVGLVRTAAIEIRNTGGAPLAGLDVRIDGAGEPSPFTLAEAPPSTLGAGQRVEVLIAFSPSLELVARGIATVGAEGVASASVALDGTGLPAVDCSDDNPCTLDTPQLDGSCVHDQLEGSCDDGNACTTGEVCVAGRCLGEALSCDPPASCFLGLCDVRDGCVFLPDPAACDDGDPCTVDVCTSGGCTNDRAPNGTPCGPFEQCVSVHVCVLGECVEAAVPEETPCSDGDVCTENDLCTSGVCSGAPVVQTAELVGFTPTFGGAGSIGAVLGDGRVVVLDPLADGRGAVATVLARVAGEVAVVAQELRVDLTRLDRGAVVATSTGSRIAILDDAGTIAVFDIDASGLLAPIGSASLLTAPASGRAKLVAFGDTWYACALGGQEVVVIDAQDPRALVAVGSVGPVHQCSGLAIDPERAQLLVSSYGGLARFSLVDPWAPFVIDRALEGSAVLVATNGAVVATADPGPFASSSLVTLFDATDLSVRGTLDAGAGFFTEAFGDLLLVGDRLFVQGKGSLSVWDVSDPSAAALIFSVDRSSVANGSNWPPPSALATDGTTLFRAGDAVFGSFPLLLDVAGAAARSLEHPARGGVDRIAEHDGVLYGMDRTSIHTLDDADPDLPSFHNGSTVASLSADATLWSLGLGAAPPRLFTARSSPGVYTGAYQALWRDGSDPEVPLELSPPFVPFTGGVVHVVDDGHRAVALRMSFAGDDARLSTWDLDALTPALAANGLPAAAELQLSFGPHEEQYGTVALGQDRAVLVAVDPIEDLFDPTVVVSSRVFVADLATFPAATLAAQLTMSGHVVSAGVSSDRVLLVVKASGSLCCGPFLGEVVRTFQVSGGALVLEGEAPLLESSRVLAIDATTALIATRRGAAFLSLAPEGPLVIAEVELPEPPAAAWVVGDRIWFAGPHGVASVRPPCP